MPEAKIFADEDGLYMQIADKNLLDKFSGREPRQVEGERKHHNGFEAEHVEPLHALSVGGKPRRRRLRAKHFPRRRVKRKSRGDRTEGMGVFDGGAKDRLMAQMDAIEVADGQNTGVAISCIARCPGLR